MAMSAHRTAGEANAMPSAQPAGVGSMRVLFVTRKFPPSRGGMEVYSQQVHAALGALPGVELDLVRPGTGYEGRPSLLQMARFCVRATAVLLARARRYDAVLLGDFAIAVLAVPAKLGSLGRARTVVALHGNDLYFMRGRGLLPALYRGLGRIVSASGALDAAVANSHAIRDEAGQRGLRAPVTVVPLGTSLPAPLPTPPREPVLLFAGRLIRYKGLAWFVREVWPHVPEHLALHVAGPVWDQAELDCLRDQPRIRYLGALPPEALPALRAAAIACVMPNLPPTAHEQDEGFGLAALEGPAVGTPTLASRSGGLVDAVVDGVTGFLLPPCDATAWIACIDTVAGWDEGQRRAFAERARTHVASHFSWTLTAERTLAVLAGGRPIAAG